MPEEIGNKPEINISPQSINPYVLQATGLHLHAFSFKWKETVAFRSSQTKQEIECPFFWESVQNNVKLLNNLNESNLLQNPFNTLNIPKDYIKEHLDLIHNEQIDLSQEYITQNILYILEQNESNQIPVTFKYPLNAVTGDYQRSIDNPNSYLFMKSYNLATKQITEFDRISSSTSLINNDQIPIFLCKNELLPQGLSSQAILNHLPEMEEYLTPEEIIKVKDFYENNQLFNEPTIILNTFARNRNFRMNDSERYILSAMKAQIEILKNTNSMPTHITYLTKDDISTSKVNTIQNLIKKYSGYNYIPEYLSFSRGNTNLVVTTFNKTK